ncbi:MAG TPA: molybdopterin-dependent oxidoreductase, partial [Candidatus Limnocylindrales bacterium]|nr:molybdopterin-dependent oxidoreductase [Candidatus Limnocylindrales bacterium]
FARRAFLGRLARLAGIGSLGASVAVVAGRVVAAGLAVPTGSRRAHAPGGFGPTPAVTPVEEFYVVAKDLVPPTIDPATWRLEVSGLVERPRAFTLDELRAFPRVEAYRTLQCISIQVVRADDLIGNQRWAGVRLRDLLAAVGVRPGASHVLWRSADGYRESLPLEAALEDRTWLVDEMGPPGTPLTVEHGYPLRVLIAGRYGMKQPKWLTGIELADHDEPGYWEQRGWDAQAVVRTYSRIDEPLDGDRVPAGVPFRVYGVANAGDRGIERVEVSADDGRSWTDAELDRRTPGLGPLTWVRWRAEVVVQTPGAAVLVVRATDGRGEVQDGTVRPPLPSGATGWHRVAVVAVSA